MNLRFLLLLAVLCLGLFLIPDILGLFAGQHTFEFGSEVSCEKCHANIVDEIANGGKSSPHQTITDCVVCHATGSLTNVPTGKENFTNKSLNLTNDSTTHAAITLACIACHDKVDEELTGSNAVHSKYYLYGFNDSNISLISSNKACIGCHTHATIQISWTRLTGYDIIVNETSGEYNITFILNTTNFTTQ